MSVLVAVRVLDCVLDFAVTIMSVWVFSWALELALAHWCKRKKGAP